MAELWDVLDKDGNKTGRVCERGKPPQNGDYHLVVHVWILNSKGEFLISKRTPNKSFPNMWECTGGSAVTGDDSLTTALKEVREELGVILDAKNGQLFRRFRRTVHGFGDFADVWIFRQDVDISKIVFQPGETCDAMWANEEKIKQMILEGAFIGPEIFTYLDELFYLCEGAELHTIVRDQYDRGFWLALDKLVSESKIVIDRPKGSRHPKYNDFIYLLDYGYLENTSSMDGNGIDVWKGTHGNAIDAIICTVDMRKRDSEIKLLIGCDEEEKQKILAWHNDSDNMKGIMIRR